MILLRMLFHVRHVTQSDVLFADEKDVPKIFQVRIDEEVINRYKSLTVNRFQILYAGEGESRKPEEVQPSHSDNSPKEVC